MFLLGLKRMRVKVMVKCHSVLAFEHNNRIVNALCAALARTSETVVGGEIKKAYLLWRSALFSLA